MNKLPEVKRFVKESGHADTYEGLEIDYVRGKPPHLIMLDDAGEETERIDLAPYSTDELHALMAERGFGRKAAAAADAAMADAVADAETTL